MMLFMVWVCRPFVFVVGFVLEISVPFSVTLPIPITIPVPVAVSIPTSVSIPVSFSFSFSLAITSRSRYSSRKRKMWRERPVGYGRRSSCVGSYAESLLFPMLGRVFRSRRGRWFQWSLVIYDLDQVLQLCTGLSQDPESQGHRVTEVHFELKVLLIRSDMISTNNTDWLCFELFLNSSSYSLTSLSRLTTSASETRFSSFSNTLCSLVSLSN